MSLRAMLWAIYDAPTQSAAEKLVLLVLADNADDEGMGAWPSRATLASRCHLSEATVKRTLRDLRDRDIIRPGNPARVAHLRADQRPNVWDLHVLLRGGSACTPATRNGGSHSLERGVTQSGTGGHCDPQTKTGTKTGTGDADSSSRPRDPMWDSIADVCRIDMTCLTATARGAMAKAVKDLKAVNATPEQVHAAAARWPLLVGDATLTPTALAKHWPQLVALDKTAEARKSQDHYPWSLPACPGLDPDTREYRVWELAMFTQRDRDRGVPDSRINPVWLAAAAEWELHGTEWTTA